MDLPSMHQGPRRRMNVDIWTAALADCIISLSGRISPSRGSLWEMDWPQWIRLTSILQERQKTRIPQRPLITGRGAVSLCKTCSTLCVQQDPLLLFTTTIRENSVLAPHMSAMLLLFKSAFLIRGFGTDTPGNQHTTQTSSNVALKPSASNKTH